MQRVSEKIYSIASPSLCTKKKSHVVSIPLGSTMKKTYSLSLSVLNPFVKNANDFPVSLPPYSRFKAVKEEDAGVFATKIVKGKGILTDLVVEAIRQVEVTANIAKVDIANLMRSINMELLSIQDSKPLKEILADVHYYQKAMQHDRTFDMEHMEGNNGSRLDTKYADVTEMSSTDRKIYKAGNMLPIEQEKVKQKLREFATNVDEIPRWVQVARILYGEGFYETILTERREKEIGSTVVRNVEHVEISQKELPVQDISDFELYNNLPREVTTSYEEFDLFTDTGIPVYMPDYDLFARKQREIQTRNINYNTANRNAIQRNGEMNYFEFVNRKALKIDGRFINIEDLERKKLELQTNEYDVSFADRIMEDIYTYGGHVYNNAQKLLIEYDSSHIEMNDMNHITHEYESKFISEYELLKRQYHSNEVNLVETLMVSSQNHLYMDYNLPEMIQSDVLTKEVEVKLAEDEQVNKKTKHVWTEYIHHEEMDLIHKQLLGTIQDNYEFASGQIKKLTGFYEEFDLFNSLGIPVYMPDYDLFARVQRELQAKQITVNSAKRDIRSVYGNVRDMDLADRSMQEKEGVFFDVAAIDRKVLQMEVNVPSYELSNRVIGEQEDMGIYGYGHFNRVNGQYHTAQADISSMNRILGEIETPFTNAYELAKRDLHELLVEDDKVADSVLYNRLFISKESNEPITSERVKVDIETECISPVEFTKQEQLIAHNEEGYDLVSRHVKEQDSRYEEFDLFDLIGTPVYLPEYDLFARIQRELLTNIETAEIANRENNIEAEINTVDSIGNLVKEVATNIIDSNDIGHIEKELQTSIEQYETATYDRNWYAESTISDPMTKRVPEIDTHIIATNQLERIRKERNTNVIKDEELERLTKQLIMKIKHFDDMRHINNEYESNIFETEEWQRKSDNKASIHEYDVSESGRELASEEIRTTLTNKYNTFNTTIGDIEQSSRTVDSESILVESDTFVLEKEKEIEALYEEFDLFEGLGIPVYLPDYDLFARIQRELQTNIDTYEIMNKENETRAEISTFYQFGNVLQEVDANVATIDNVKVVKELAAKMIDKENFKIIDRELQISIEQYETAMNDRNWYVKNITSAPMEKLMKEAEANIVVTDQLHKGVREFNTDVVKNEEVDRTVRNVMMDIVELKDMHRNSIEGASTIHELYEWERKSNHKASINTYGVFENVRELSSIEIETTPVNRRDLVHTNIDEIEQFNRILDNESILVENDTFKLDNIYQAEEPVEFEESDILIEEEPKIWLKHSRESWWNNWNWKKTR